jgi:hypothetical protein
MQGRFSARAKGIVVGHQRPGHLFQGRYTAELIEDESYYWTVNRHRCARLVRNLDALNQTTSKRWDE